MKGIPSEVLSESQRLFWDVDVRGLDPEAHEDFILGRVLTEGSWEAIRAVRAALGDDALRAFVIRAPHRLTARARRFYEVVLSIPEGALWSDGF